jgi:hypothetical protein
MMTVGAPLCYMHGRSDSDKNPCTLRVTHGRAEIPSTDTMSVATTGGEIISILCDFGMTHEKACVGTRGGREALSA